MRLLRHPVAAIVIFVAFISLFLTVYNGFQNEYSFTQDDIKTIDGPGGVVTGNIAQQLTALPLLDGIRSLEESIKTLQNPANAADLVGALALAGIGVLKTVVGLLSAPLDILLIVAVFYGNAAIGFMTQLLVMLLVYVSFILLSAYLRSDL